MFWPNPIEVFQGLWSLFNDPAGHDALLVGAVFVIAGCGPLFVASYSIRRYAKNHGRVMPSWLKQPTRSKQPFVDSRLNEAVIQVRRVSLIVGWTLLFATFAVAVAVGIGGLIWIGYGFVVLILSARALFIEACIAFGAEMAPEPAVEQLVQPSVNA